MGLGTGLATQAGFIDEATPGSALTVTRFYEVDDYQPNHGKIVKTSNGLRGTARGHRERNRVKTGVMPTVKFSQTVMSKGFGLWFKHMTGNSSIAQIAASPTWRQIHLIGDLAGKTFTSQFGVAETYTGTVRPYTYNGCKIPDWELACQMDDLLKLNLTIDAWNWATATALASPAYLASLEEFHWALVSATIGGTATTTSGRTTVSGGTAIKGLRGISLKGTTALRADRRFAGGGGVKSEQIENDFRALTGNLDLEFADRTQIADLQDADTSTVLQFTWVGITSDGAGNFPTIRATYPAAKFDTGSPQVGGPDVPALPGAFTAYEDNAGVNPLFQLEYESQDTAI